MSSRRFMTEPAISQRATIFDIQSFSLHDGPGIRTTVFLKGCPLRCAWCFNPESHLPQCEVIHYPEKCIGCDHCFTVCAKKAISKEGNRLNKQLCDNCGACVEACPAFAMQMMGRTMTSDDVLKEVLKDKAFYGAHGGVTLSGGEAAFQKDFACDILEKCKKEALHTAVETCGYAQWEDLRRVLAFTDLVFYDIKAFDAEKHKRFTGADNAVILENAVKTSRTGIPLIICVPVIPGYNDDEKEMNDIARFIKEQIKPAA
ncbi:MAG: glycyl-radical enzyme activating protein, partial [Spirochaetia bacterium]|nr:glycyl-radical enzyme activating protein [Spirochaetia bacterium]